MTTSEAVGLLTAAGSGRMALKRAAAALDAAGPDLKRAVRDLGRARGVELPDEAESWPAKKLLRRALGREAEARVRRNPIHRDEAFRCVACKNEVPPHGRSARDHCPYCLVGLHVDADVPGDRASPCHGILDPIGVHREAGRWILAYRCRSCGASRRNQVLMDGDPPDDWSRVTKLAGHTE